MRLIALAVLIVVGTVVGEPETAAPVVGSAEIGPGARNLDAVIRAAVSGLRRTDVIADG